MGGWNFLELLHADILALSCSLFRILKWFCLKDDHSVLITGWYWAVEPLQRTCKGATGKPLVTLLHGHFLARLPASVPYPQSPLQHNGKSGLRLLYILGFMDPVTRKQEGLERATEKTLLILKKKEGKKTKTRGQKDRSGSLKGKVV